MPLVLEADALGGEEFAEASGRKVAHVTSADSSK